LVRNAAQINYSDKLLVSLTQQGIRDFKDSPDRAATFKSMAEKLEVKVKEVYWTMGVHDAVLILEAPDDKTVTAAMLGVCPSNS